MHTASRDFLRRCRRWPAQNEGCLFNGPNGKFPIQGGSLIRDKLQSWRRILKFGGERQFENIGGRPGGDEIRPEE
jgi:hypothetical protein